MDAREVRVFVTMAANELQVVRDLFARACDFPGGVQLYAENIQRLLKLDHTSAEAQAELETIVECLKKDALQAEGIRDALAQVLRTAVISDPEGRKEPLQ